MIKLIMTIFIVPIFSQAADFEYSCQLDRALPMLKSTGTKRAINISKMKVVFSQNAIGGYLPSSYFLSDQENFKLDEKLRPLGLEDKGFKVTHLREKSTESCMKQAQLALMKSITVRAPAQEAVDAIGKANQDVQKSTAKTPGAAYGYLSDNTGKKCVGFRCNTNPEPQPQVKNNVTKVKSPTN